MEMSAIRAPLVEKWAVTGWKQSSSGGGYRRRPTLPVLQSWHDELYIDDFYARSRVIEVIGLGTVFVLDRRHTCDFLRDFFARVRDFIARLSSCRLRLCRVNRHVSSAPLFPFHDPPSQFQNDEIVPYPIFSGLLDWIVRFRFARQPTKTKLLTRIS